MRLTNKYIQVVTAKLQAQAEYEANVQRAQAILDDAKAGEQIVFDSLHQSKLEIQALLNRLPH